MFKRIPGNHNLSISLSGEMKTIDDKACTLDRQGDFVSVEMYGQTRIVDIKWLAWISHYEVNLPGDLRDHLWNISFRESHSSAKKVCGQMMVFKKPITFAKYYRIIPGYTDYAVSKDGVVISVRNGLIVKQQLCKKSYTTVDVYNPDKSTSRSTALHRLIALAWVPNNNIFFRFIVNHINGIKDDVRVSNLEWVTVAENNNHAFGTGLRTDNIHCRVRNVEDGSVTNFISYGQACVFMGFKNPRNIQGLQLKTRSKLIGGKYEFKLDTDTTPWFYENFKLGEKAGRYGLNITNADGTKEHHPDVRTFKKKFGVWNVSNVYDLKAKAEKMYPGMSITIDDHYIVKPVQALDIASGRIIEAEGVRPLAKIIDRTLSDIHSCLRANETRISKGFAYRYKTDKEWDMKFTTYKSSSRCISATNPNTNEKIGFRSLTQAAKYFRVDRTVIKRCVSRKINFKDWQLRESEK